MIAQNITGNSVLETENLKIYYVRNNSVNLTRSPKTQSFYKIIPSEELKHSAQVHTQQAHINIMLPEFVRRKQVYGKLPESVEKVH